MSHRTYPSVRYRYWCRIELTEVSGTGNTGGTYRRYASVHTVPNTPLSLCSRITQLHQLSCRTILRSTVPVLQIRNLMQKKRSIFLFTLLRSRLESSKYWRCYHSHRKIKRFSCSFIGCIFQYRFLTECRYHFNSSPLQLTLVLRECIPGVP